MGCKINSLRLGAVFVLILVLSISPVTAAIQEFTKDGNGLSWTSGSYATNTHCIPGQTCSWVVGNQVIVGVYDSNPNNWGGTVRWDFDLSGLTDIQSVELKLEWPHIFGKGLHSPYSTGGGSVGVKTAGNLASLTTNTVKCAPTNDWYAHPCGTWSLSYDVPLSSIEPTTKVYVTANSKSAWDIKTVTLFVQTMEGNIHIIDGKMYVNDTLFMVKGVDYSPWFWPTGPSPVEHDPFPGEHENITEFVGPIFTDITDYNGDGEIQTWELVQYDLDIMKEAGVNMIRTYASGEWHDRDLDGVWDADETVQGDLPMWALDRLVNFSEQNNMTIIIGYWVQEENYDAGMVCDWDDLEVAKDTMSRLVDRYSDSPAVLAWGIGNEVYLDQNHEWFTWGVDICEYLNSLYTYVRSIDDYNRPIMYAKYIGEPTTFDTITADIIAPNAYIWTAQQLIDFGEFDIPAPEGKAYMIGEFGHLLNQSEELWNLSQQYAGGFFLEHNDVWWKGTGYLFGIVRNDRELDMERYYHLLWLYRGILTGDITGDCVVNIMDLALVAQNFGKTESSPGWNPAADVNKDGLTNIVDIAFVAQNFGKSC